jgi:hypothetical protein
MTAEQRAQAVDEIAVVKIWPLPRRGVRVFEVEIHFYPRRTKVPLPQGIWTM